MSEQKQARKKSSSTSSPAFTPRSGLIQRKCACGGSPGVDGECAECRNKRLSMQRSSTNQAKPSSMPLIVHDVLSSPGQQLDAGTRAYMEPRIGHDFSKVRVHIDARAAESARSVNALAYTVGQNVVFGSGQYRPDSIDGKRLMAHELTHVVQQDAGTKGVQRSPIGTSAGSSGTNSGPIGTGAKDSSEKEAEQTAQAVGSDASSATVLGICPDISVPHKLLVRTHPKATADPAVREAQRKLNLYHAQEIAAGRAGLKDAPLVEDCVFGDHTQNAVVSFQQQKFPKQPKEHDGKIGDHTWAELDKVVVTPPSEDIRKVPVGFDVKTDSKGKLGQDGKVKDLKVNVKANAIKTVNPPKSNGGGGDDDPLFQFTSGLGIQMPTIVHLAGPDQPDDPCNHIVSQIGGKWNWKGFHPTERLTLGGSLELDLSFAPASCKKSPFFTPQLQEDLVKFEIMKDVWDLTLQGALGLPDDWLKNAGVNTQVGFELDWKPWGAQKNKFYSGFKLDADGSLTWTIGPDKTLDVGGALKLGFEFP